MGTQTYLPQIQTGKQCHDPYECPFLDHCASLDPPAPEHPIELLPDTGGKALAKRLRETNGYTSILEPDPAVLISTEN